MKRIKQSIILFFLLHPGISGNVFPQSNLSINNLGYLYAKGISVLAYHNYYFVGRQGAIEVIVHDKRIMTNGMVKYTMKEEALSEGGANVFSQPIPETDKVKRIIDKENNTIILPFRDEALNLDYAVYIKGKGTSFNIQIVFNEQPDLDKIGEFSFEIELYPGIYRGKTFSFEKGDGYFPFNFASPVHLENDQIHAEPLGSGNNLALAPEAETGAVSIKASHATLYLLDTRRGSDHNWITLKAVMDMDHFTHDGFSIDFSPSVKAGYSKKPVLQYSQLGYHPGQKKHLIIEVDTNYVNNVPVSLYAFDHEKGHFTPVSERLPEIWGRYKRYQYLRYDFTTVTEEGLYYVEYAGEKTNPFRINSEVYAKNSWEPVLQTFIPVQMCHMRVKDRIRIWHGACHLDDALQAPVSLPFYDGFSQGESTETPFAPLTTIPGLNKGGWHDAGDDDVNTNSTGLTVYHLALIKEEFGINADHTTIDFENREVYIHQPDGEPDVIQQMKHGLDFILPQYDACGHGIVGMISNTYETYLIPGTWGHMTDNLFYNKNMDEKEKDGTHSGKMDDRYAFTNKDSRAEYRNARVLAASARVLKESDPSLADKCLQTALKIWETEQNTAPVFYRTVGVPGDLREQQVIAATELFLNTKDDRFLEFITGQKEYILEHMEQTAWGISRIAGQINDKRFIKDFENQLKIYNDSLTQALATNPYGVYLDATLWGFGWDILWRTYTHYYLVKHYPDIFSVDPLVDCNEFMLGCHPYSNVSYVSGVGTGEPIPAFGMNRSDFYYIPGGVFSGVNIIEPDFPELMDNHPFIWQQSEYIIHGATPYIFTMLAVDRILGE